MKSVACVFGTFNRFTMLKSAVESVRLNAGVSVDFIVVDGGSTDGSRQWLAAQPDVQLLGERGELKGAVRAFNLGFAWAVEHGYEFVFHFNDDAVLETPNALDKALHHFGDPSVGAVAFRFDLFKTGFDCVHGKVYSNFGVLRTKAAKECAQVMGDPTGAKWWNPIYRTYGADSELGCWMWKLGWKVVADETIRVRDLCAKDELRRLNEIKSPDRSDSKLFWSRWEKPESITLRPENLFASGKLHLGCGTKRLDGWLNVDGIKTPATDYVGNIFEILRSVPKGSLEKIYSSHVIEHIPPDLLPELFSLARLALKPSGVFRVATISLPKIMKNRWDKGNREGALAAIYGETRSIDHSYASHRWAFDGTSLREYFINAGFKKVCDWKMTDFPKLAALRDYALTDEDATVFLVGEK